MKNENGQSLIEVTLAIGVAALILVALVALATLSLKNAVRSRQNLEATKLAQDALEWLRGERDNDWDTFYAHSASATWCMPSLSWGTSGACAPTDFVPGTKLIREVNISAVSVSEILAEIVISWMDGGNAKEVRSSTYFTRWQD